MDDRKAKIIDALLAHLEEMDAGDMKGQMMPKEDGMMEAKVEESPDMPMPVKDEGPMEELAKHGNDPKSMMGDEDMSEEELEEMAKLNC